MSVNIPGSTPAGENGAGNGNRGTTATTGSSGARAGHEETRYESRQEGRQARQSVDSLRADLNTLKTDLDALVSRASNMSERELSEAYARMMSKFSSMRFAAKGIAAEASRQLNQGVDRTTDYVKAKPLQSVALAAGVGLVVGILAARR